LTRVKKESISQKSSTSRKPTDELTVIHSSIRNSLAKYDDQAKPDQSLADMWDECMRLGDPTEFLNTNLRQFEVLVNKCFDDLISTRAKMDRILSDLEFGSEEQVRVWLENYDKWNKTHENQLKMMNTLGRTAKDIAKEVRAFAAARRSAVHVSVVQKLMLAIRGIIHDEIHDENLLAVLCDRFTDVMRSLFPSSAETDV